MVGTGRNAARDFKLKIANVAQVYELTLTRGMMGVVVSVNFQVSCGLRRLLNFAWGGV